MKKNYKAQKSNILILMLTVFTITLFLCSENKVKTEEEDKTLTTETSPENEEIGFKKDEIDLNEEDEDDGEGIEKYEETKEILDENAKVVEVTVSESGIAVTKGDSAKQKTKEKMIIVPEGSAVVLYVTTRILLDGRYVSKGKTIVWRTAEDQYKIIRIKRQLYKIVAKALL